MDASSAGTLGRGFSCGLSNMGVASFPAATSQKERSSVEVALEGVYYGTSQGRNGVLSLLSCMTVGKEGSDSVVAEKKSLSGCLQFVSPLISAEEADRYLSLLLFLARRIQS